MTSLAKPSRQARLLREAEATARRAAMLVLLRQELAARCAGFCECCKMEKAGEMHHVLGGSGRRRRLENPDTLIMLCVPCHQALHASDEVALRRLVRWASGKNRVEAKAEAERRLTKVTRRVA